MRNPWSAIVAYFILSFKDKMPIEYERLLVLKIHLTQWVIKKHLQPFSTADPEFPARGSNPEEVGDIALKTARKIKKIGWGTCKILLCRFVIDLI